MTPRLTRMFALLGASAVLTVGMAIPVSAQNGSLADLATTTTTTTAPSASDPGATTTTTPQGALEGRYQSLTAAMMSQWALNTGATVDDVVGPDGNTLAGALGTNPTDLRSLGVNGILGSLDSTISQVTLGVNGAGADYEKLRASLPTMLNTPDGKAIAAGVTSARTMAQLSVPDLSSPGLIASSAPLSSIGPDSLAFGLFLNQSLTSLAQSAPDVFSTVLRPGGVADPAAATAWGAARTAAATKLGSGFSGDLMNPCLAVMFSSMASGEANGNPAISGTADGCGSCAIAGAYMGGNLNRLFSGDTPQRLIIPEDNTITDYEWDQLGSGGQQLYYDTYPGLKELIEKGNTTKSADAGRQKACDESQAGTTNFLGSQSSGILSRLGG